MRKIAIFAMLLLSIFVYFGSSSTVSAESADKSSKNVITVKSGDSLSKIAKKHKSTYKRIFYANKKIKDPNLIFPGDKLRVPGPKEKLAKRPINTSVAEKRPQVSVQPKQSQTYSEPQSHPVANPQTGASAGVWDRLAKCESGGNWSINTGNGYYGGLQFSLSSWRGVGGTGYPHQATKSEQIRRAELLRSSGGWGHWPACTSAMGLR